METTQLVQQVNENLLTEEKTIVGTDGDCHTNGECLANNGDCETNKMLNKGEAIELSASHTNIRCCNGMFAKRGVKKTTKKIVKEPQANGTSNGKCYFSTFKEKLTNGKHTQLIDEGCDMKKPKKVPVFDDRDPFKINSNVRYEFLNVFAEPNSGTYSFDPTWSFTSRVSFYFVIFFKRDLCFNF